MKLFFRACVLIASMALSGVACAVGMGGITVSSALGEPLNAEIELAGIGNKANKASRTDSLTARMASPDVFKGAGVDYPSTLPSLKFAVESRPDGEPYLRITSQSPVNDPFVTLLVELDWPSGRLLREYTFLLDPPGFKPEQPAEPMVKPIAPVAVAQTVGAAETKIEPAPEIAKAPVVSGTASGSKAVSAGRTSTGNITIKRGDTLSKIARQVKPSDISLERMLVALYRANADEFGGRNMNRLRVGKILRMPNDADVEKTTQAEATEEIHAQAADWNAYRQKLAAASVTAKEPLSSQEVSGKIGTKVAETPSAKGAAKEVVRLSKGMAPGDNAVAGGSLTALQDKMNGLQEELIARDGQLKDSKNRIAMLENNIKEMRHLLDLKSQNIASSNQAETRPAPPSAAPIIEAKPKATAMPSGLTTAPLGPDHQAQQANSAAKPKPARPLVVPPPPSMMDEILDEPLYLAGIAVVVLLLLGGGFMVMRRNRTRSAGSGRVEHNIAEPAAPSAAVGETNQTNRPISAAAPMGEEVDPVSEADLFLNFGRDTQAEEILKYALEKDPTNQRILLKLLSIYLERKDAKAFYAIFQQVRESGDANAWAQAAEMGRKLEPDNPAYSGEAGPGEAAKEVEPEQALHVPSGLGLDFDLDFDKEQSGTGANTVLAFDKPTDADSSALDFDLGADFAEIGGEAKADIKEEAGKSSTGKEQAAQFDSLQGFIDVTSKSLPIQGTDVEKPGPVGKAEPDLEDFVDISSKSLSFPFRNIAVDNPDAGAESEPDLDDFIDVTSRSMTLSFESIDADKSNISDTGAPVQLDALNFQGIDLSLSEPSPVVAETDRKDAHWNEISTKIDLARAYQEMGDVAGAHEIWKEVMDEGDDQQRAIAKAILEKLSA